MNGSLDSDQPSEAPPGWRRQHREPSLQEVFRTVPIPTTGPGWFGFLRKLLAFTGPGYLIAVGYMDPGNWATDLAGGSQFYYSLLFVVIIASLMAIFLQHLALKLGIATGRDLAQACRDHFNPTFNIFLWIGCEIAIAACDLAEVIGSAIALNLLFGIPLTWGVCLTAADVLAVLFLQRKGFRLLEAIVIALIGIIAISFGIQVFLSKPDLAALFRGCLPSPEILHNRGMLYVAIGILGATVMPHNLYLHSSIAQTRKFEPTPEGKREAVYYSTIDVTVALLFALFINAAIMVVAAATFYRTGHHEVAEIQDAYRLLSPLLGVGAASTFFAVALLASGQNSTLTGTLAGQIVMEGFLDIRLRPVIRRLITRLIAILPAVIVSASMGESGTAQLLILSQVILSLQLSFAVIPLVLFTSNKTKMGDLVNPLPFKIAGWIMAGVIALLNVYLVWQVVSGSGGS